MTYKKREGGERKKQTNKQTKEKKKRKKKREEEEENITKIIKCCEVGKACMLLRLQRWVMVRDLRF